MVFALRVLSTLFFCTACAFNLVLYFLFVFAAAACCKLCRPTIVILSHNDWVADVKLFLALELKAEVNLLCMLSCICHWRWWVVSCNKEQIALEDDDVDLQCVSCGCMSKLISCDSMAVLVHDRLGGKTYSMSLHHGSCCSGGRAGCPLFHGSTVRIPQQFGKWGRWFATSPPNVCMCCMQWFTLNHCKSHWALEKCYKIVNHYKVLDLLCLILQTALC